MHPPMPQANPPDKVIFPSPLLTPNIMMEDPRLAQFAESMRRLILNPPGDVRANQLEFEAKLGEIVPDHVFKQCID